VAWLIFLLAVVMVVASVIVVDQRPRTHDAYLFSYSAGLAPEVSGRILQLKVTNNQLVRKGQSLVEIDPEPFTLKLHQAQAQVAALRAEIDLTTRQVSSQGSGANAAVKQADRARAQLGFAQTTLARLTPLMASGYVTAQQLDEASSNEREAAAALSGAIELAAQAHEAVGDVVSLNAQLVGAKASEALAARDLREATLRAPFDGRIVGLELAEGSFANSGRPLFTLIKANNWYAVADFRETDLKGIHIGDGATVWVMGHDDQPVKGHVESLGAGVQPEGVGGPGLPTVDRNLNWVVVAQRFPVWIRIEGTHEEMMRIGATASVRVTHGH
jgi:multidrug efflux system membrane fusion protein